MHFQMNDDENTQSTPADDATDVNSCRMEFFFYFLLLLFWISNKLRSKLATVIRIFVHFSCTWQVLMNLYSKDQLHILENH